MDINLPLDAKLQMTLSKAGLSPTVELKLNQVLDAKLIANQQILNALAVQVGDKTLNLQAPQRLPLQPGQSLQLQVVKLTPLLEFKLLAPLLNQNTSTATSPANALPVLRQIPAQLPSSSSLPPLTDKLLANVLANHSVSAQILATTPKTVTLQLTLPATALSPKTGTSNLPTQITLDRQQMLADSADPDDVLEVGNRINLSLAASNDKPLFGISNADTRLPAEIAKAFKQLLPMQLPINPLLNQLGQIQQLAESGHSIGDTLKQLAQSILHSLPDQTSLMEPAKLKQLVRQSGLFMESGLAQTSELAQQAPDLQPDLKFKLSNFIAELQLELAKMAPDTDNPRYELLKELAQKTEGHLAKLTLDQLFSLPKDDSPKQVWVLALPFFNPDQPDKLELLIEQDRQANPETGQKNWVVSITITPPELGTIHCKLSCYDGSVNARFWSETPATADKINARLDYLKQQFEQKGLNPGFMDAQAGKPVQPNPQILPPQTLLSEKA